MDIKEQHARDVGIIQGLLMAEGKGDDNGPVALSRSEQFSNTVRSKPYSTQTLPLDSLCRVLEIDTEKRIAHVEPRVTVDQLVKATLPLGLVPAVVPEFKSITVGGGYQWNSP